MDKMIRIACKGYTDLPYTELHDFQGDLKTLTEENYKRLKAHILDTGFAFAEHAWLNPDDQKWYIIDGHQRVRAIRQMVEHEGYQCPNLPVVPVEARDLAEAKRRVLQGTSQFGRMEGQGLYEFMSVNQIPIDEVELKFDLPHINMEDFKLEYFKEPEQLPPGDPDAIPDQPTKCIVNKGDLWTLGRHRLLCGDSAVVTDVETLMAGEKADMIFTDPPWNVNYGSDLAEDNPQGYKPRTILNDHMGDKDWDAFTQALASNLFLCSKPGALIYLVMSAQEWPTIDKNLRKAGFHWSSTIIWAKDRLVLSRKDYHTQYEPIWYGWNEGAARLNPLEDRSQSDLWNVDRPHKSELHPTTKPIELIERAIKNSSVQGALILDLFGGSGSTLIAAEQTQRRAFLCELAPGYAQVILERWARFTGQDPVRQDGVKLSELLPNPEAPAPDAAPPQA